MRNLLILLCLQLFASTAFAQMNPDVLKGDYADHFKKVEAAIDGISGIDKAQSDDLKRRVSNPSANCTLTVRTYKYNDEYKYWDSVETEYPAQFAYNKPYAGSGINFPTKEIYTVTTPEVSASVSYLSGKVLFGARDVDSLGEEMVIMDRKSSVSLKRVYLEELGAGVWGADPQDWVYNFNEHLTVAKPGMADQMFEHLSSDPIFPSCNYKNSPTDCPVDKNYIFKCEEIKANVLGTKELSILEGHEPVKFDSAD